ncbi:Lrp/AsnC family transcriptional regulator [Candidatus Thorarchaeota archaeon]|nr:MAG: Lrp/AsnC family transcriptional regulator [Candidatus Thorarchaeota archaeon]
MPQEQQFDELDFTILRELQTDSRIALQDIANKVGAPTSTVHYRIKRLEKEGVIDGYYAHINAEKLGLTFLTIIHVRAAYGPGYHKRVGEELANIRGIWAVYFTLGDNDFIVITRSKSKTEYLSILEKLTATPGIERTSTLVVGEIVREDFRLDI